jgi:hypothetical protein
MVVSFSHFSGLVDTGIPFPLMIPMRHRLSKSGALPTITPSRCTPFLQIYIRTSINPETVLQALFGISITQAADLRHVCLRDQPFQPTTPAMSRNQMLNTSIVRATLIFDLHHLQSLRLLVHLSKWLSSASLCDAARSFVAGSCLLSLHHRLLFLMVYTCLLCADSYRSLLLVLYIDSS